MTDAIAKDRHAPLGYAFDPVFALLTAVSVLVLFYRFIFGSDFLAFYHDDFFYYVKIASNLLSHKGMTFDGIHATNGFHPLYLLFIVCLKLIAPGTSFFVLLQAMITAAVLTTYRLTFATITLFSRQILLARIAAACIAYFALVIMRGGMEIVLTIPLASGLIWLVLSPNGTWSKRRCLFGGLLAGLTILSRLDSALLIALLLLPAVPAMLRKCTPAKLLFTMAGFIPVFLYLGANIYWFRSLMPISGQAKQLRTSYVPSLVPIRSVLFDGFSPTRTPFTVLSVIALFIGLFCLCAKRGSIQKEHWNILTALLVFPLLHLAFYSILSDWQFFPWYFYPLVISLIASSIGMLIVVSVWNVRLVSRGASLLAFAVSLGISVFSLLLVCSQRPGDRDVYANAKDIRDFAERHGGTYAMGDRAGYVGYLIPQPVIQLEGLVEDKEYLNKLKEKEPLRSILDDYRVTYYVGANPVLEHGCYKFTEPLQGGPTIYRTQGTFCQPPLAIFHHGAYETAIFSTEGPWR